jgi:hypothetical protein
MRHPQWLYKHPSSLSFVAALHFIAPASYLQSVQTVIAAQVSLTPLLTTTN